MKGRMILSSAPKVLKACLGLRVPLRVSHCITYRCNLDCGYCSRHNISGGELSTGEIKALMKSFRDAGCLFWSFNGGEPLVRQDIAELIDYGKRLGMYVSLATNGTLIAERIGEIRNADLVSISIDGPKSIQDEARCASFDRIIEGLSALKKEGVDTNFGVVVGKHNIGSLDDILKLAQAYDTRVFFQPIRVQKEDKSEKSRKFFPSKEEMRCVMDHLIEAKMRGAPVASSIRYLRLMKNFWPDGMPDVGCWAGRVFCFITPEGYATSCCDTLAYAAGLSECDAKKNGSKAFWHIPRQNCSTCYSSIPLETNILMGELLRNPSSLVRHGLLRPILK